MKLLNRSLFYLSIAFFFIIGIWSIVFYINLKDEIRDSIDDGLENNKMLLLQKVATDTLLLSQREFGGNNFEIHPISQKTAIQTKDVYKDTLMYRKNENDLEPVRILHSAFQHGDDFYRIKVISSLVEEDDLIEDAFWSVMWLFLILVGSIIIINNLILRRVWNPFYEIVNRLEKFRMERTENPIAVSTNISEFVALQKAANALIQHSTEAYESQKQFTENAAHELQTPLAIIYNKLELLLESGNLQKDDAHAISEVMALTKRISQLNQSLLLLSKIENKQFASPSSISLNQLASEILNQFNEYIEYRHIAVEIAENESLQVEMDPALARVLISNLIRNAIFHNKENGNITVHFTSHKFSVCNGGPHTALDSEKVFQRFQKDPSKNTSTGLGLAVCKAVCNFYGFSLTYHFKDGLHCFVIVFPKDAKSV